MPKGIPNKRYTAEFKQKVVEAVVKDGLSYKEAARLYEVQGHSRIQSWERIYLEEGPEGLALERRGRKSTGRPKKLPSKVEEDLLISAQHKESFVRWYSIPLNPSNMSAERHFICWAEESA